MKILNVVFDFGGVVFDWNPAAMVRSHFGGDWQGFDSAEALGRAIFSHADWLAFDRGERSQDDVIAQTAQRLAIGQAQMLALIAPIGALRGGMPLYKFVGNIVLTRLQNLLVGAQLSEWHTGYRAYRVRSLTKIDFVNNSNAFDFDTQIILQMIGSNQRIAEISIPTFYGQEISHVNSIKYGLQIIGHTLRFRFSQSLRNTKTKN